MPSNAALDALGHAVSGSIGTGVSTAAVFPLDLVTTRLKAQRQMKKGSERYDGVIDGLKVIASREGGIAALYNGMGLDIGKSLVDSFLFFGFYTYLRQQIRHPRIVQELAMGALAGACSRAITTPISNVVTRMQVQPDTGSLRKALADIKKESGVLGLWSGYSATLVLTMNPSMTFFINRRLAKRIIPALEEEDVPVAWVDFLLAAISKSTATVVTYPFQTGRTRLQMPVDLDPADPTDCEKGQKTRPPARNEKSIISRIRSALDQTVFGIIIRIITREGLRALYDGLPGELLKGFLSHGLTMVTKGLIHRLVIRLWILSHPRLRKQLQ
ncbi:peroxisomal adenine nucleotide transporter 1 [Metarhizium album ARSEF 1941]|uniref:Peroxisomal adenine nucleotide transporter 1 n=1 Tax=Metarhizium album (strain ARSEF 1941) TaxID=1081103 RepID=A0A0B2X5Y6_METAS|nr:peroxisomal adenine nucleotide transporter 1 [Metarhizium album ARSEF 1941]KHO00865.1 peroxisomal adenine nucleotide transporter 1 [Metarhizium album ARSEF 1941]